MLRHETGRMLGAFIFKEVLCRWGGIKEIVTNNGTAFVAVLDWLQDRYGITHICISTYNSCANGIVKCQHHTIQDSIVKACNGEISRWPTVTPHIFWADRVTTWKSTRHSPFYMAHGIEPILPFDITEATFLIPDIAEPLTHNDLLALHACQLEKRNEDLTAIHSCILRSCFTSARQFSQQFTNTIHSYDFKPSALVLVCNSTIEMDLRHKAKPHFLGPMLIVRQSCNRAYRLAELNGAVSKLWFAAFCLIPYHAHSHLSVPITHVVDEEDFKTILEED